jgi:hypothetical protein
VVIYFGLPKINKNSTLTLFIILFIHEALMLLVHNRQIYPVKGNKEAGSDEFDKENGKRIIKIMPHILRESS